MKKACCLIGALAVALAFAAPGEAGGRLADVRSWLCYYGSGFPSGSVPAYDLYVFQAEAHPELAPLRNRGARAVGYLSAGEIHESSPAFAKMSAAGVVLEPNPDWPGAHRVDICSDLWRDHVLTRLVPDVLAKGFDGVFIDTIDAAAYLEREKGKAGAIRKAAALVREIRKRFPDILIVLGNGLFLSGEVGDAVDALLVEDIFTLYDFKKKRYKLAPEQWTEERLAEVQKFQRQFGKPVLSLDYLRKSDAKNIKRVALRAESLGFVPYIATIDLDTIFFHP